MDLLWHLRDSNGSFSSGKKQTTETLEHALHTLLQFAFPAAFPDELNVYSSNGRADGISGGLQDAYEEAVRNGVYDPSDYSGANDGSDGYGQLLLREYIYCLVYAEWGFTNTLTEEGTLAPEWSDAHLSPSAIARDNPLGHKLFTNYISKIISKPSLESLQSWRRPLIGARIRGKGAANQLVRTQQVRLMAPCNSYSLRTSQTT